MTAQWRIAFVRARRHLAGRRAAVAVAIAVTLAPVVSAHAQPTTPSATPKIAALAPPDGNDARRAVVIGAGGEVYQPDGKGAWIRKQRFATGDAIASAGRAGGAVVAFGEGVIYKLAPNGWSAMRLAQKGKAVMATGPRAVAAIGRQLYSLDRSAGGEPAKLPQAASNVIGIGSGRSIVVATDRGLFRVAGAKLTPIRNAPRDVLRLVGDHFALGGRGAIDLETMKLAAWPSGFTILAAAVGPDERTLVGVGKASGGLELVTVAAGRIEREPMTSVPAGKPVGVAVDRDRRAVVAFADGRVAIRERGTWTVAAVRDELPAAKPGAAPATSP